MSLFTPLAGTTARRRLYLLRHGHVAYYDADGKPLNPKLAALTDRGREEARVAGVLLAGVPLDRVLCSGLARTRQTAELVAAPHGLPVEDHADFLEIRASRLSEVPKEQREAAYVYGFEAVTEDARFAGGDSFAAVRDRVVPAIETLIRQPGWTHLALVAHDGVNRMLLSWACGGGLSALSAFEQDYGCINIIDLDVTEGRILRRLIRAVNLTPGNPAKIGLHRSSLEEAFVPLLALD
ncbi:phosphoglycerate mutase [Azospirillum sp. TSH100]|uniref:histidine phosphatase family protein n=1 Tax=Azospirillum sp. TSH100 TaxID=652764 RepID=UPI000D621CC1|nr:histidine phosphatase family protein [Azospirillum sp. TSH100]PWC90704.1 phosphoglycerate mutase [Azospirillum sp. TSH100]QCG90955.1 histidine phosphatase family protein [Azospirillum sp. TSH100]